MTLAPWLALPLVALLAEPAPGTTYAPEFSHAPVARLVRAVPVAQRVIALSFDDGPSPRYTPEILGLLKAAHARATFFVVGREAQRFPQWLRQEQAAGMEIGNHGMHHRVLAGLTAPEVEAEVREGAGVIQAVTGRAPRLYRLPQGRSDELAMRVLGRLGYVVAGWSVDPKDYRRHDPEALTQAVLHQAAPGRIIILHDGGPHREATVAALSRILPELSRQGYRIVGVEALLRMAGLPLPAPGQRRTGP